MRHHASVYQFLLGPLESHGHAFGEVEPCFLNDGDAESFFLELLRDPVAAKTVRDLAAEVAPSIHGRDVGLAPALEVARALSRVMIRDRQFRVVRHRAKAPLSFSGASGPAPAALQEEPKATRKTPFITPDQKPSWLLLRVVWDGSSAPVSRLPLVVETTGSSGSSRSMLNTDARGLARFEVPPRRCDARSSFKGLTAKECAAFVAIEDETKDPPEAFASTSAAAPKAIVNIQERRVRKGDMLERIAQEVGMTGRDLAFFNWGTKAPDEVNEHLSADIGCTKRGADGSSYVFDDSDSPGVLLLPRPWTQEGLAAACRYVVRVRPVRSTGVLHVRLHVKEDALAEAEHRLSTADDSHEQSLAPADGACAEDGPGAANLAFAGCPTHLAYSLAVTRAGRTSACFREVLYQEASDCAEDHDPPEPEAGESDSGDEFRKAEPPEAA